MNRPVTPDLTVQPGFRRVQWRMLLAVMFCYLFYYTGRQSWGFVVQDLQTDLGLGKEKTGWIAGACWLARTCWITRACWLARAGRFAGARRITGAAGTSGTAWSCG